MANNSEAHSKLVNETLLEIGKRFKGEVVVWKNHTGQAMTPESVTRAFNLLLSAGFAEARAALVPIKFGVVGQCDISGIRKSDGKRVEIEVKTGTGRLSDKQKIYRDMIVRCNGIHIELRKLSDLDILVQKEMKL